MSAALELAGLGIEVDLVEREEELGGQWRSIRYQADGSDAQAALAQLRERVGAEKGIRLHLGSEVRSVAGRAGRVPQRDRDGRGRKKRSSTGWWWWRREGKPARTSEYLYGQHPGVLTQRELEERESQHGGPGDGGDDPVRREPGGGEAVLQPHLLHAGDQERAAAEGAEPQGGGVHPLPGGADLWLSGGVLPGGAGGGRGVCALRAAGASRRSRRKGSEAGGAAAGAGDGAGR